MNPLANAPYAFALVLRLILCVTIVFGGGYWIIASWFDRRLLPGEAVLLLVGLVVFMFLSLPLALQAGTGTFVLLLALVLGVLLFFRYYAQVLNARALKQMDDADIASYRQALELDPHNVAAHSLLAKLYRKRGQLDLALQEYEAALKLDPSLQEERYWVSRLKSVQEQAAGGVVQCHQCGAIGPLIAGRCQGCGAEQES